MNKRNVRILCLLLLLVMILSGCAINQTQNPTNVTNSTEGGDPVPEKTTFYFAVGSVDETAKTAKVLNGDGEVLTISWDGQAPVVGTVNPFTKNGDVYTAQQIETEPVLGPVFVNARQKSFWTNQRYYVTNESIFFVRYSDTEWRVYKGRDAFYKDCNANLYICANLELDGLAKVVQYVMVVGSYGAAGEWAPANKEGTIFLDPNGEGWDSGDINLS